MGKRERKKKTRVLIDCCYCLKRWRELWRKTNYEDWLYRRSSQLAAADDDSNENSIYELPERVSSSRPMATSSSYYSSATILASDSGINSYNGPLLADWRWQTDAALGGFFPHTQPTTKTTQKYKTIQQLQLWSFMCCFSFSSHLQKQQHKYSVECVCVM